MKILLAYSGGLDTSAILVWLKKELGAEVTCFCGDLGENRNYEQVKSNALMYGADEFIVEDLKKVFVEDYVIPLLISGAQYQGKYLLGTAIARPILAARMAHVAKQNGMDALAHGATGKGNDQLRFENTWAKLSPDVDVISPWKTWTFKGRQNLIDYLTSHGYEYNGESGGKYSIDENIFHKSTEGGELEDIQNDFSPFSLESQKAQPKITTKFSITFEKGVPIKLDNSTQSPLEILSRLNQIGEAHGQGIVDVIEDRINGIKSRGIYQTPGGSTIRFALEKLKELNWNHDQQKTAAWLGNEFAENTYNGLWHSNGMKAIHSYFLSAAETLSGKVNILIKQQQMFCTSVSSEFSLYDKELVSFESDRFRINQSASGFCHTRSIPMQMEGAVS